MSPVYPLEGSLTRRIALIGICMLALPLLIHSLFLYRQEYERTKSDVQQTLLIFGEERVAQIEEAIQYQAAILGASQGDIQAKIDFKKQMLRVTVIENGVARIMETPLSKWTTPLDKEPFQIDVSFVELSAEGPQDPSRIILRLPIDDLEAGLQISVPEERIVDLQVSHSWEQIAVFLVLFVGLGGGLTLWLTLRFGKPLGALALVMKRVGEGALHVRYRTDRLGFEVNALGSQFNETVDLLLHHQKEAEEARLGRERLVQELRIGHSIQKSMLPMSLPEVAGIDLAANYVPAEEVSGDFYDFFPLPGGRFLIAIADVSGKGISACLYALSARGILRSLAMTISDLAEMMRMMNRLLYLDSKDSCLFVTLWVGIYDEQKRFLEYCSQGHFPGLLRRGGHVEELPGHGVALGVEESLVPRIHKTFLQSEDLLILYTDGLIDAEDSLGHRLGQEKLKQYVAQLAGVNAQETLDALLRSVSGFSMSDDLSIVMIRTK